MELTSAPAVRTRRKSRWSPSDVQESIVRAMVSARACPSPIAVIHDGEVVGVVRGDSDGDWVEYIPFDHKRWCGFNTYADLKTAITNGHGIKAHFRRELSAWNVNGQWADTWPVSGSGMGVGDYSGTANTARQFDNTTPGNLWRDGTMPGVGETRHLIGWRIGHQAGTGTVARQYILYDRVLAYDGASISTTITNFTNTLTAQRYIGSGEDGLMVTPTVAAAVGATASAISSLKFTDDQGNTNVSQSTSMPQNWSTIGSTPTTNDPAFVAAPYDSGSGRVFIPWLPLGGIVRGVRKLESVTSSANNTGTISWVLHKPIATLWCNNNAMFNEVYLPKAMFTLEKIFDTSCLAFLLTSASSNTNNIHGWLEFAQG